MLAVVMMSCYYDNEEKLYGEEQCSGEAATYAGRVSPIIRENCLQCHSAAIANGGVVLEGYDKLKIVADNGKLVGAITHASGFSPMPKNAPMLSSCDIDAIRQWVNDGALNN